MTTLQQLYEEFDGKTVSYRIIVAGADITRLVDSFSWQFSIGEVPSATLTISVENMVPAIKEEAEVEIWFGYKIGLIEKRKLVFGGAVIDSVSYRDFAFQVECIQDGARRLNYPYYKEISYNFDNVTAQDAATALLVLAGVTDYVVDLDPWDIGTAVPQTLKFSNYGDAINKVSTVDGSEWFCLPSGQVRVEKRDPLPYDDAKRTYYSANLTGIVESQPSGVPNPAARPRVLNLSKSFDRAGVNNFINVDGATVVTLGPNGEQNSDQIHEEVDAAPGNFDNGAPWITTPPLFQPFTYSNELIDTNAKANAVANRYLLLKNRLIQKLDIQIPCDPELFLCETIQVIDDRAEVNDLYFLQSYRCNVSANDVTSDLTLLGGHYAGTQGHAKPFAEFRWTYEAMWNQRTGNPEVGGVSGPTCNTSEMNLGFQSNMASKLCQDLPADVGSPDQGGGPTDKTGQVFIGFDGTLSEDFDGEIVSWDWSDDQGHTASGPRVMIIYDPDNGSTVNMTLTVTDDTARTDTITKSVFVGATAPVSPLPDDPTLNDTNAGGGAASGDCTEGGDTTRGGAGPGGENGLALIYAVAARCKAMMSADNQQWNMLDKDDLGVGNFISTDVRSDYPNGYVHALFGTDDGQIVKSTDGGVTGGVVHDTGRHEDISSITFDGKDCDTAYAFTSAGAVIVSHDLGDTWSQLMPRDNIPIHKTIFFDGDLYAFGGNTNNPDTLIRKLVGTRWESVDIRGDLYDAVHAAGAGFSIVMAYFNTEQITIGFNGGVSPLVWRAKDLKNPEWEAVSGITGTSVKSGAPDFDAGGMVSTDAGTFSTTDGSSFSAACPNTFNDMSWEGLPGTYIGVADDQISKIVNNTCGPMMPNAGFPGQNPSTLPACAQPPKQIKIAVVPRPANGSGIWPVPPKTTPLQFASQISSQFNTFTINMLTFPGFTSLKDGVIIMFTDLNVTAVNNVAGPTFNLIGTQGLAKVWKAIYTAGGPTTWTDSMTTPSPHQVECLYVAFNNNPPPPNHLTIKGNLDGWGLGFPTEAFRVRYYDQFNVLKDFGNPPGSESAPYEIGAFGADNFEMSIL